MNQDSEFPFDRARRVTSEEHQRFEDALSKQFGIQPRERGHTAREQEEQYEQPIWLRFHQSGEAEIQARDNLERELAKIDKFIINRHKTRVSHLQKKHNKVWSLSQTRRFFRDLSWGMKHLWNAGRLKENVVLGDIFLQILFDRRIEYDALRLLKMCFSRKSLLVYLRLLERRKRSYTAAALIPSVVIILVYALSSDVIDVAKILTVMGAAYALAAGAAGADNNRRIDVVSRALDIQDKHNESEKL
ncbi:MAG: hypothetical protein ACFCU8_04690 [Thermosynechococcaceae cyanobacterium]